MGWVYGVGVWGGCMVCVHGVCAWRVCMVHIHGVGARGRSMGDVYGLACVAVLVFVHVPCLPDQQ